MSFLFALLLDCNCQYLGHAGIWMSLTDAKVFLRESLRYSVGRSLHQCIPLRVGDLRNTAWQCKPELTPLQSLRPGELSYLQLLTVHCWHSEWWSWPCIAIKISMGRRALCRPMSSSHNIPQLIPPLTFQSACSLSAFQLCSIMFCIIFSLIWGFY